MSNQAAQTAVGPMVIVAVEQNFPPEEGLIQDGAAYLFLPPRMKFLVRLTRLSFVRELLIRGLERKAPGTWGLFPCRKRYVDDRLADALSGGIGAIVNLGAGLDTRAYRVPEPSAVPFFEVDLPENIERKRRLLRRLYGRVPAHVTLVPMDFNDQNLGRVLAAHGYQIGQKSFFIWEAVTQYLSEAGVRKTFDFLAEANPGSQLVFTYVRKDFIDGVADYGSATLYEEYRVKGQLWHFGMEPEQVAAFLEEYSWKELEQAGSQEFTARYVKPSGRALPVSRIERAVYAEKT